MLTAAGSSLLGHEGIKRQEDLIKAIPRTTVKLFVPSDLAFRCDDLGIQVPVNRAKRDIEQLAKNAGIPTTIVLPGCLAESSLSTTQVAPVAHQKTTKVTNFVF